MTSSRLTGSLELRSVIGRIDPFARQLLCLPNGLNFAKIELLCADETDFELTTDLVTGCSHTLETLSVTDCLVGVFPSALYLVDALPSHLDHRPASGNNSCSLAGRLFVLTIYSISYLLPQCASLTITTIYSGRLNFVQATTSHWIWSMNSF